MCPRCLLSPELPGCLVIPLVAFGLLLHFFQRNHKDLPS